MTETERQVEEPVAAAAQQAVDDAVARERARMARELHDGIATELAAAIWLFKLYLEASASSKKDQGNETLVNILDILTRLLQQVREALADLRPRPIGHGGLVGELRQQADDFARLYGIRVELSRSGTEEMLPTRQREVVYQVVREGLTNVRRHSRPASRHVPTALPPR